MCCKLVDTEVDYKHRCILDSADNPTIEYGLANKTIRTEQK